MPRVGRTRQTGVRRPTRGHGHGVAVRGASLHSDALTPPDPADKPTPDDRRDLADRPDDDRPATGSALPLDYEAAPPRHDPYAALRHREFRLLQLGFLASVVGSQTLTAAAGWEVYTRTGSKLALGWLGLALAIPVIGLALPAGQVVDTFSRKRVLFGGLLIAVASTFGLAALNWWHVRHEGGGPTWGVGGSVLGIYALLLTGASGLAFSRPARQALVPQIMPRGDFPNAVTWNSGVFQASSVAGPILAGLLLTLGPAAAYLFAALCWVGTLATLGLMQPTPPPAGTGQKPGWSDLLAGVRFVLSTKLLVGIMTLDLFAVLLGGAVYLLPVYATDVLHVGEVGYGWLKAAPAIGALGTSLALSYLPPIRRAGPTLLWAVAGFGAATVVFGFSTSFALSMAALALTGAFDAVSVVVRTTVIQLATPDAMRGRVSAVNGVFVGGSNELGGFESGATAAAFGPVASVVGGGIGTILVVVGIGALFPAVRRLGSMHEATPDEATLDEGRGLEAAAVPSAATPATAAAPAR